jgi:hypothetical protein
MTPTIWTQAELDILIKMWPEHSSNEVITELNKLKLPSRKSKRQVKIKAYNLGLKHTPATRKRIKRETILAHGVNKLGGQAYKESVAARKAGRPKDAWLTAAPVKNTITRERIARGVIVTTHRLGG